MNIIRKAERCMNFYAQDLIWQEIFTASFVVSRLISHSVI